MHITALVCHNGLGHMRRVIGVLQHLSKTILNCNINIICSQWQIDSFDQSADFLNQKVRIISDITEPGIFWSPSVNDYKNEVILTWHKRLQDVPQIFSSNLVISDNLSSILHYRSDAILMGSFLWSDILSTAYPESAVITAFAQEERRLLKQYRPPMICVDPIVMPAVDEYTQAIKVAWMCHKHTPSNFERNQIAILGGATGVADNLLANLARKLLDKGVKVTLPKRFASTYKLDNATIFDFTLEAYAKCRYVIARPGVGTVTDCVAAKTPILAVHEILNPEMSHLGKRIDELGIGIYAGSDMEQVVGLLPVFNDEDAYKSMQENLATQSTNGLQTASNYLIERYKSSWT